METSDSYRDSKRPAQLFGIRHTSSEYPDANNRMIKRKRVKLMRTLLSQVKSTVEYQVEEATYEEIDESLPMAPPLWCQRDDIMSSASEKCLALPSLPAPGVSSTAVSVPSELDGGVLVPRHALNNDVRRSDISRMMQVFLCLGGTVSDSDCSFAGAANGDSVTSNSNEMSDRSNNEASLPDTATLSDKRLSSTQVCEWNELVVLCEFHCYAFICSIFLDYETMKLH